MAETAKLTIFRDAWTQVPVATSYLAVQLGGGGSLRIHISDVEPTADNEDGVIIAWNRENTPSSFGAGNLPTGVMVFVRAESTDEQEITYLTY
jgi:hypothetical protein